MHEMFPHDEAECFHGVHDPVFKEFEQCHKVAIFGKPLALLVYLETLRQVAKIDHAQGQIQWFPPRTFSLLLIFLVSDSSSVSIFSTL